MQKNELPLRDLVLLAWITNKHPDLENGRKVKEEMVKLLDASYQFQLNVKNSFCPIPAYKATT